MIDLYGLRRAELENLLREWGYSAYHARLLWRHLYQAVMLTFSEMRDLRTDLLHQLTQNATIGTLLEQAALDSSDGQTRKVLLKLIDGQTIETVFMRFRGRATVCVSTQVGCAMGCIFCATGQMGFIRNLAVGEIVAQVVEARRHFDSHSEELKNVVFMGMGEPLHNYQNTLAAIDILTDDLGLAIAPTRITVSTIGLVPAIRNLARDNRQVNLAVSLHGASNARRTRLAPVNERWPLNELISACRYYTAETGGRIFFEWIMIKDDNDSSDQAQQLGRLLAGLPAHVNLIPYNPTAEFIGEPSGEDRHREFQKVLSEFGIPSTVRQRRGIDIEAGCGQLRTVIEPVSRQKLTAGSPVD